MPIYDSIVQTVGRTPMVRLNRVTREAKAEIYVKLEFFNPLSSVKDRIGASMIAAAEAEGRIHPETLLVEPTSGNTGIALAFVAAARGLRLKLVMPDSFSRERMALFQTLGAELELTPGHKGMQGAIDRANSIVNASTDAIMLQQFENPANPLAHELTTAEEIWADTDGDIDAIVAGVGTGGTITGCTRALKRHNSRFKAFAVEPDESPVLSGGPAGPHLIQGIGAGFVPRNLDTSLLDGVVRIKGEEALEMARRLATEEGILCGISSGANVAAAIKVSQLPIMRKKKLVTVCCSSGERYLSTALFRHLLEDLPSPQAPR